MLHLSDVTASLDFFASTVVIPPSWKLKVVFLPAIWTFAKLIYFLVWHRNEQYSFTSGWSKFQYNKLLSKCRPWTCCISEEMFVLLVVTLNGCRISWYWCHLKRFRTWRSPVCICIGNLAKARLFCPGGIIGNAEPLPTSARPMISFICTKVFIVTTISGGVEYGISSTTRISLPKLIFQSTSSNLHFNSGYNIMGTWFGSFLLWSISHHASLCTCILPCFQN
jgi:hypothetical protein